MKPTTSQIDAYCAAFKAWANGERVEFRVTGNANFTWTLIDKDVLNFPSIGCGYEYRIAPAAPTLREFWLQEKPYAVSGGGYLHAAQTVEQNDYRIHVREVSETADAEIAEKLRNHDALCGAIKSWAVEPLREEVSPYRSLCEYLNEQGITL